MTFDLIDSINIKRDIIATGYQSIGYRGDGGAVNASLNKDFDLGTMDGKQNAAWGASCLMPLFGNRKGYANALEWTPGNQVSGWKYAWNTTKANVMPFRFNGGFHSNWDAFKNLDWVDSKVAQMEGILRENTPKAPEFSKRTTDVKNFYEKLQKANSKEFKKLLNDTQNQQLLHKLKSMMGRNGFAQLENLKRYQAIYAEKLNLFKKAQTALRTKGKLPKGMSFDALHQQYAQARLNAPTKGLLGKVSQGMAKLQTVSKGARTFSRWAGKAGGPLMVIGSTVGAVWEVGSVAYAAPEGKTLEYAARQTVKSGARMALECGGAWAGAKLGAAGGAAIGACFGGVGAPIGAFVGGLIGGFAGFFAGKKTADNIPAINDNVLQVEARKQKAETDKMLVKAVNENDTEKVAAYVSQFLVPDEQTGEIAVDEQGQPKIAQVCEDKKDQADFEKRVRNLFNYVQTEEAKKAEAEQIRQQYEQQLAALQQQRMAQAGQFGSYTGASEYVNPFRSGNFGSYSTPSWQNPAFQDVLGSLYNSGSLNNNPYANNPFAYTPYANNPFAVQSFAPAA